MPITDLYEGVDAEALVARLGRLVGLGVNVIVLLEMPDTGRPGYDPRLAGIVAGLGIPVFACTPDEFADPMACTLTRENVETWAASADIKTIRPDDGSSMGWRTRQTRASAPAIGRGL